MITPEIIAYINAERAKTTPDEIIKSNLLNNGWRQGDVNEAMMAIATNTTTLGAPTISISPAQLQEIKQYRKKIKWIVFAVLSIPYILFLVGSNFFAFPVSTANIGVIVLYLGIGFLVIYGAAYLSTLGTSPRRNIVLEIGALILKIIGAVLLAFTIIIGLFFILCLFAASTGHGL